MKRFKMEHSANFEKVKGYYEKALWNEKRVRDAVVKNWITEEEYAEITNKPYVLTEETE